MHKTPAGANNFSTSLAMAAKASYQAMLDSIGAVTKAKAPPATAGKAAAKKAPPAVKAGMKAPPQGSVQRAVVAPQASPGESVTTTPMTAAATGAAAAKEVGRLVPTKCLQQCSKTDSLVVGFWVRFGKLSLVSDRVTVRKMLFILLDDTSKMLVQPALDRSNCLLWIGRKPLTVYMLIAYSMLYVVLVCHKVLFT